MGLMGPAAVTSMVLTAPTSEAAAAAHCPATAAWHEWYRLTQQIAMFDQNDPEGDRAVGAAVDGAAVVLRSEAKSVNGVLARIDAMLDHLITPDEEAEQLLQARLLDLVDDLRGIGATLPVMSPDQIARHKQGWERFRAELAATDAVEMAAIKADLRTRLDAMLVDPSYSSVRSFGWDRVLKLQALREFGGRHFRLPMGVPASEAVAVQQLDSLLSKG